MSKLDGIQTVIDIYLQKNIFLLSANCLKNFSDFEHFHSKFSKSANATFILLFSEHLKNSKIKRILSLVNFWGEIFFFTLSANLLTHMPKYRNIFEHIATSKTYLLK
jgi:hypothetical protein